MDVIYDFEDVLQNYKPEEMISDEKVCLLLKKALSSADTEASLIISILHKLEPCVTSLNQDHKALVKAIMNINWLDGGPDLVQVYHAFVLDLLSAHTNYFKPFLVILVKKFREEYKACEEEGEKVDATLKKEQDFQHVHRLLQSLCRLIPMTTVVLVPLLEELFPYINKGVSVFENYTCNLLKITRYVPSLRLDILNLIVKHMLKLDSRISREALLKACGDEEEGLEDVEDEDIFSLDMDGEEKCEPPKAEAGPSEDRLAKMLPEAASLDSVMTIMLNYIKDTCFPGGKLDWTATKKLYRELLSCFDKYIFPTYLSNHTQFILFYICSFREALADGFIDYLWKKVTDPMSHPIYRQIASCYIGSFLARANYLPISTARTVMKLMMEWVHDYLNQTCDVNIKATVAHHAAFYSVCQTCFYIFCFRHMQLLQTGKCHKWAGALNFQRVITSKLNPLKYCLPLIIKTFSSATRTHQLAFCDTIIERNNRYSLPVSSSHQLEKASDRELHSFFPFDPYLLKKSGPFITPLYKEYQGNLPDEDVMENEDEDDFLPDEDVHLKSKDPLSMSWDVNSVDLLHYSVSPGFLQPDMS